MVLVQTRTDDLNGEPDAHTCVITVNGEGIEIDLAEKSMLRLVKALEPFWKAGSPGVYDIQRRGVGKKKASAPDGPRTGARSDSKEIRAWAARQGIPVPARGKVPVAIAEAYDRA